MWENQDGNTKYTKHSRNFCNFRKELVYRYYCACMPGTPPFGNRGPIWNTTKRVNTMSNSIKNVVTATANVINTATSTISVGSQLIADGSAMLNKGVLASPDVLKSLLEAPFAAAKGYIMESDGVTADVAEARAYKYIKQSLAQTITDGSEGAGKLMVNLFDDDDTDDDSANALEAAKQLIKEHKAAEKLANA